MAENQDAIRSARPNISIDGREREALTGGLLGLMVVEELSGLYRCEALFGNWGNVRNGSAQGDPDFLYFDRQTLEFGKPFKVTYDHQTLFDGRIMALEAQFSEGADKTITALAEDRFQDLRMTRRTRTWLETTDNAVVREIASNHGLQAEVELPGGQHKVLAQVNQSDLAFLRQRGRAIGAEVWVSGSKLYAKTRSARTSGSDAPLELAYNAKLREFSALADLANQRTEVSVTGWDVAGKQAIKHEAAASILSGELNGDVSGPAILQQVLGARKEQLSHTVPATASEAQATAEAFYRTSARQFVTGHGRAEPQAKLHVGNFVKLTGLGPLFSGKYYVTEVRHIFDGAGGLRTEFAVERAGIGRP
jgi:phage protein D